MTTEHEKKEHVHHHEDSKSEEKSEDNSKNSLTIVLIIIGIILVIIAAIVVISKLAVNNNKVIYNHYEFDKYENDKWITQQSIRGQLYNIPFYNNPKQVENIPIDPNSINLIRDYSNRTNATVYISIDPFAPSTTVVAAVEYARILGTVYNIYNMNVKSAIQKDYNSTVQVPIITCANQSDKVIVIYPIVTDKDLISVQGSCIIIESSSVNESIKVADAFSFRLLNMIMDNTTSEI